MQTDMLFDMIRSGDPEMLDLAVRTLMAHSTYQQAKELLPGTSGEEADLPLKTDTEKLKVWLKDNYFIGNFYGWLVCYENTNQWMVRDETIEKVHV